MAQIFSTGPTRVPSTPPKGGTSSLKTDLVPGYSPGPLPQYILNKPVSVLTSDVEHSITTGHDSIPHFRPEHPILPVGEVFYDIRNHLKCYSIFNNNIETLLSQFLGMKTDLEDSRAESAELVRAMKRERDQKVSYKMDYDSLSAEFVEIQQDLQRARNDASASEARLALAISQLAEAGGRLDRSRTDLRTITRERDVLTKIVAEKQRELEYYIERDKSLVLALEQADAGQNTANDRNTRLTQLLYEIETQKAMIERRKDQAESRIRLLEQEIEALERQLEDSTINNPHLQRLQQKIDDLSPQVVPPSVIHTDDVPPDMSSIDDAMKKPSVARKADRETAPAATATATEDTATTGNLLAK